MKTARQLRRLQARRLRKRNKQVPTSPAPKSVFPGRDREEAVSRDAPNHIDEFSDNTAPVSDAKLAANRANARLSTGPRTEEGKAISSRNNTRHGLAGDFRLMPGEDAQQFQILVEALTAEHNPNTSTETLLVWDMARHHWLTQRAIRLQDECLTFCVDEKKLNVLLRYQTTHQRAFHKCLADLLKLQKQRKNEARGFESQNRVETSEPRLESHRAVPADPVIPAHAMASNGNFNECPLADLSVEAIGTARNRI